MSDKDVLDELLWLRVNTMSNHVEEVSERATAEIERLRAENERMRAAGDDLAAGLGWGDEELIAAWQAARRETDFSVWFGWATTPDFVGTKKECEDYVARHRVHMKGYADRLTIQVYRKVANDTVQ